MVKITVEELEIVVDASIEKAVKNFKGLVPTIKKEINKIQEEFNGVKIKDIVASVDLKTVDKQVKETKKKISKTFDPNDISGLKISGLKQQISGVSNEFKKLSGSKNGLSDLYEYNRHKEKLKEIQMEAKKTSSEVSKIGYVKYDQQEIESYINNSMISGNKVKNIKPNAQNLQNNDVRPTQESLNLWERLRLKIEQVKVAVDKTKSSAGGNIFSNWSKSIKSVTPKLNGISGVTVKIKNQIKEMGAGMKRGLSHVLRYAGALFSLRGIYSVLSNSAQSWLSSQNKGAQQLSANIEYMKYAMGSAFAPIIEYVINLVYQLMKAIQSVVYAFSGINIFAKATASSMNKAAGSASKASKSLAGVHNEINNVSQNTGSGSGASTPEFDLSKVDPSNRLLDAIKNRDWSELGILLGEKLNGALDKIPWDNIQNKARSIATNITGFLNNFIGTTDWYELGNSIAQGLNTAIYFAHDFIVSFDWKQFGTAISEKINGMMSNIDWAVAAQTLSGGIVGILNSLGTMLAELDWQQLARNVATFVANIDWSGLTKSLFYGISAALWGLGSFIAQLIIDAFSGIGQYFGDHIKEAGGNIVLGIYEGIDEALDNLSLWIYENIFVPFIDGFKDVFGIHSPSLVMEQMGEYLIQGLLNGLLGLWEIVKSPFEQLKNNVTTKFTEIKSNIGLWTESTKRNITEWANNMRGNISGGLNNAKTTIETWGGEVKQSFSKTISNATTWGKDLVTNMSNGIRNNIGKVTSAVNSVASKIKSLLGFSEPEEGPLSNFHTYMPDMIDLMVEGIRGNMNKVEDELTQLASNMSYTINTPTMTTPSTNSDNVSTNVIQPRNVLAENIEELLSGQDWSNKKNSSNEGLNKLVIQFGSTEVAMEIERLLKQAKRQNGTACVEI